MSEPLEIEAVLDRFRQWLTDVRSEAGSLVRNPSESAPEFGLIDLVEQFTALRQELKLQTKSTRGLQEQAEALLPSLRQAIEQFRSVEPREAQAAWTAGKPLAEGLATLDEALERGRAEIEKVRRTMVHDQARALEGSLEHLYKSQSWLRRKLLRRYHDQVLQSL